MDVTTSSENYYNTDMIIVDIASHIITTSIEYSILRSCFSFLFYYISFLINLFFRIVQNTTTKENMISRNYIILFRVMDTTIDIIKNTIVINTIINLSVIVLPNSLL